LAALDCARGANPDFAVLLSGFFAAVDWIREASAPVIFVSPPFSAYGNALPRSVSRERSFVRQSYK